MVKIRTLAIGVVVMALLGGAAWEWHQMSERVRMLEYNEKLAWERLSEMKEINKRIDGVELEIAKVAATR